MASSIKIWIVLLALVTLLKIIHIVEVMPKINKSGIKYKRPKGTFGDFIDLIEYEKVQRQNSKSVFWYNISLSLIFIIFIVGLFFIYHL
jgi:hypothetical protein